MAAFFGAAFLATFGAETIFIAAFFGAAPIFIAATFGAIAIFFGSGGKF